jgi:hypothetical protein
MRPRLFPSAHRRANFLGTGVNLGGANGPERTFKRSAANGQFEPKVTDIPICS